MVPDIVDKASDVINRLTGKSSDAAVDEAIGDYMDSAPEAAE